jgi:hypothetical protein
MTLRSKGAQNILYATLIVSTGKGGLRPAARAATLTLIGWTPICILFGCLRDPWSWGSSLSRFAARATPFAVALSDLAGLRRTVSALLRLPPSVSFASLPKSDTSSHQFCFANSPRLVSLSRSSKAGKGVARAAKPSGLTGLRPPLRSTLLGQLTRLDVCLLVAPPVLCRHP